MPLPPHFETLDWGIRCSYNSESPEVTKMESAVAQGRSIDIYEPVQGMVDYQRLLPPARIYACYAHGRTVELDGRSRIDREGLVAIEFYNTGPGLKPSDLVDIRRRGEKRTLGKWGRGTSVALTYLATRGITVEVESNAYDPTTRTPARTWTARTSLRRNDADQEMSMHAAGRWENTQSNHTVFRVLSPPEDFVDRVERLPHHFLFANPRVPASALASLDPEWPRLPIVATDADATEPPLTQVISQKTGSGQIICLEGVIPLADRDARTAFVDGLRVPTRGGERFLFPWAFFDLSQMQHPFGIGRDFDSTEITGNYSLSDAVQEALRHNTRPALFARLLDASLPPNDGRCVELSDPWSSRTNTRPLTDPARKVLRAVWDERFGPEVRIADSDKRRDAIRASDPTAQVVVVHGKMYRWLEEAGIVPGVERQVLTPPVERMASGNAIHVGYAKRADAVQQLLLEAAEHLGTVRLQIADGRKAVEVVFPYSILHEADFSDRKKPGAQWARVAAVVAQAHRLTVEVTTQRDDALAKLEFGVSESQWDRGAYQTTLAVTRSEADPVPGFPDGVTQIVLRGDALQRLRPPTEELVQSAAELARKQMEARAQQMAGLPTLSPRSAAAIAARVRAERLWELAQQDRRSALLGLGAMGLGAVAAYFNRDYLIPANGLRVPSNADYDRGYGDIDFSRGIGGRSSIGADEGGIGTFELRIEAAPAVYGPGADGESPQGYYRKYVGTQLIVDGGEGRWISVESYQDSAVARAIPPDYAAHTRLGKVEGRQRLPVRTGLGVVAVVGPGTLTVKREPRTGNFIIAGSSAGAPVDVFSEPRRTSDVEPIAAERQRLLDVGALEPHWRDFLQALASPLFSDRERQVLVLHKWSTGFTYLNDNRYNTLLFGDSVGEIASGIVNRRTGPTALCTLGLVALLREVGVPARQVAGDIVDRSGRLAHPHAWVELWDGRSWQELEPLLWTMNERSLRAEYGTDPLTEDYLDAVSASTQASASMQWIRDHRSVLEQMAHVLRNPPASLALLPPPPPPIRIVGGPSPTVELAERGAWSIEPRDILLVGGSSVISGTLGWWLGRIQKVREAEREAAALARKSGESEG